ncbi:DUF58 domain-containing protein [Fodinibacter luteus]|uniref:DUF58 domain-containing protein n=1 Tax=Fodinibacter luteus TaxID=552064 RepID=A0ABP8KK03_9MICO
MRSAWRPTRALGRAAAIGLVVLVVAAVGGRGDLAVVGAPLVALVVWSLVTRPTAGPVATSAVTDALTHEGDTVTWRVDVTVVPGLRDAVAHLPGDRWTTTTPAHGHVAGSVARGATVPLGVLARTDRWGVRRLGPAQVGAFGDFASFAWTWPEQRLEAVATVPTPGTFTSRAGLPHPVGLVGQHRGARAGGGTELFDVRPFRTGDRLRRIHWPVSLRTGALHVTTTYADQDAEVRVVVDAIRDLGERDPAHGRRSSLDVAVEAAGAVAAHYLGTGDRVGLSVLGGGGLVEVPAVGGRHQLARVLLGLGRAEPSSGTVGEERALRAQLARRIPPGAFVVLLSALVSAEPLAHAVRLGRSGHEVVVVDTLPPELSSVDAGDEAVCAVTGVDDVRVARLVWRLRLLDREREARRCAAAGVPVIPWRGPGSLDTVLRQSTRRSRRPRVVAR